MRRRLLLLRIMVLKGALLGVGVPRRHERGRIREGVVLVRGILEFRLGGIDGHAWDGEMVGVVGGGSDDDGLVVMLDAGLVRGVRAWAVLVGEGGAGTRRVGGATAKGWICRAGGRRHVLVLRSGERGDTRGGMKDREGRYLRSPGDTRSGEIRGRADVLVRPREESERKLRV